MAVYTLYIHAYCLLYRVVAIYSAYPTVYSDGAYTVYCTYTVLYICPPLYMHCLPYYTQ